MEGAPTPARNMAVYRVGLSGGVPRLLFPLRRMVQLWCTKQAAIPCVFEQPAAGRNELVVAAFDPLSASEKELRRIPLDPGGSAEVGFDYAWQISPDASQIAVLRRHKNRIRLAPVNGGPERIVTIRGYSDIKDLSWTNDSRSLMASAAGPGGSTLLRVDLNGNAFPVWRGPQTDPNLPVMSPDGRHLAISAESFQANVWMIDNF